MKNMKIQISKVGRLLLPNRSFNRTCFGVAAPGIISFLPGFATLAHAG